MSLPASCGQGEDGLLVDAGVWVKRIRRSHILSHDTVTPAFDSKCVAVISSSTWAKTIDMTGWVVCQLQTTKNLTENFLVPITMKPGRLQGCNNRNDLLASAGD